MITERFSAVGVTLALLLAAVHQGSGLPQLTSAGGTDSVKAVLEKNQKCLQEKSLKSELRYPYDRCLHELLEMLKALTATGQLNWNDCGTNLDEPEVFECKVEANFMIHKVQISNADFLNYISSPDAI